jgi:hypothetical protein
MSDFVRSRRLALAAALALAGAVSLQAQTTWYVDDVTDPNEDGSSAHPFDAIQEGIDAASGGDTVLVLDGTYTGVGNREIEFKGKAITVRSQNGPTNCIVDLQGTVRKPGFVFDDAEDPNSILDGFTITNLYDSV